MDKSNSLSIESIISILSNSDNPKVNQVSYSDISYFLILSCIIIIEQTHIETSSGSAKYIVFVISLALAILSSGTKSTSFGPPENL